MRYATILLLLAAVVRAEDDLELRFLRAWYAIGEPEKAAAAEETFRALYEAEGTPEELKARCLLALAECARVAGDEPKARGILEQVIAAHPRTDAAARARRSLGPSAYLDVIRVVTRSHHLDLDDGTVSKSRRPAYGKEAEMRDTEILVEATTDEEFATKVAPCSVKPWRRVRTNEGRTSWVQVLEAGQGTVVRLVTRLSGVGEVLPAPRNPFCLGRKEGIEIFFEPSDRFARCRIERSADGEEPVELGAVTSPFLDRTADADVRYLYRITGEAEDGSLGLPVTIEGTRQSCGVVSGIAGLDRRDRRSFDFLLGKAVEEGDLALTGIYGNWDGASFTDAFGREVRALAPAAGDSRASWDDEVQGTAQMPSGSMFVVPLRGGGVARGRLELPAGDHRAGDLEVIVHYEACGDSAALPRPVRLAATRGEEGAVITVEVDPPYLVGQVEVTDLAGGQQRAPLEVKDGIARDPSATEGQVREYRAVAFDRDGRRSAATSVTLALLPDRPRAGEFRFHYQQGFSIETGRVVPADQADVFFETCAGGIASITLAAPGGIVNLERVLPEEIDPGTAQAVFDMVLRADPSVGLDRKAQGDARNPATDVFVLRTRHGGWAKLAITHRGREGGWSDNLATVKYVFNGKEPVFGQGDGEMLGGITIGGLQALRARAEIVARWRKGWQEAVQDPVRRDALEEGDSHAGGGVLPDPATTQEVLWSRQRYKDYEKATFNFVFGIRDDPDLAKARNDWCLQYGNGGNTFDVCMVTDDRSTITDLGASDWPGLARRKAIQERDDSRAPARFGHIYLVHTFDTDENFFTLLRVTALRPGDQVAFEWLSVRGGTPARSPGLVLDERAEAALKALLAALPATPEKRWEGKDAARAIHMALTAPEFRIGVVDADPAALLRDLGEITGIRFRVRATARSAVSVFGTRLTPEGILDAIAEQTGLPWRIEEDGSVSLGGD